MIFDPKIEPYIFVIIILIIVLTILGIIHKIQKKMYTNTNICQCTGTSNTESSSQTKNKLCLYYANWCGYSQMFLPEWKKIVAKINSENTNKSIECIEYECTDKKDICAQNNIRGFPTIILYKIDGTSIMYPYDKPRDTQSIIEFAKNNI